MKRLQAGRTERDDRSMGTKCVQVPETEGQAKGKLLRFAQDSRMSAFKSSVPLGLEKHLVVNTKN